MKTPEIKKYCIICMIHPVHEDNKCMGCWGYFIMIKPILRAEFMCIIKPFINK